MANTDPMIDLETLARSMMRQLSLWLQLDLIPMRITAKPKVEDPTPSDVQKN